MHFVDTKIKEANKFLENKDYVNAKKSYSDILDKFPKNARALNGIKTITNNQNSNCQIDFEYLYKMLDESEYSKLKEKLSKEIRENPNQYELYNILGSCNMELENFNEAELNFKKSISLNNKSLSARNNLGILYKKNKNLNLAIETFKKLVHDFPNNLSVLNNLGNSFVEQKDYRNGIKVFQKALKMNDNFPQAHHNLGIIYREKKLFDEAITHFKKAVEILPTYRDAIMSLADGYRSINDPQSAIFYYQKALKIKEDEIILNKLGLIYFELQNYQEAENFYKKSIVVKHDYPEAHFNLAILLMHLGIYNPGFKKYNWRWKVESFDSKKLVINKPKWALEKNKTILIWPEQGIGDQILLSRFFNDLIDYSENLKIIVDPKLINYFKKSFPNFNFQLEVKSYEFEYQLPMGDLPSLFINNVNDVKERSHPYLYVDKNIKEEFRKLFPVDKKICGLSWVSNNDDIGFYKSLKLEKLKDVLSLKDVVFLDLQYSDTTEERENFFKKNGIEILKFDKIDNLNDIYSLASLIDACDFVLSISNTNVHLSGAIGKKTFLMLPKGKGKLWYWSANHQKSHWYNSVKIIEQKEIGNWKTVIREVVQEIGDI